MKWRRLSTIVILAAAIFTACSSPVYIQRDESASLAKYRTYAWVETRANEQDQRNASAFAQQKIHDAVREELSRRGWTEVNNNPDVLLSYDILVERSTQQKSDPVYTQPVTRMYYNPYLRRWGTVYYPSQFLGYDTYDVPVREGTLTLSMMDAQTDKALWQGWTTEQLDNQKITQEEIRGAVRRILKKLDTNQ